eukprot:Skav232735  [mRNA]  locus=scaffold1843:165178:173810:- [translate_table: standard]
MNLDGEEDEQAWNLEDEEAASAAGSSADNASQEQLGLGVFIEHLVQPSAHVSVARSKGSAARLQGDQQLLLGHPGASWGILAQGLMPCDGWPPVVLPERLGMTVLQHFVASPCAEDQKEVVLKTIREGWFVTPAPWNQQELQRVDKSSHKRRIRLQHKHVGCYMHCSIVVTALSS